MKKMSRQAVLFSIALVCGFMLTGCPDPNTTPEDTWEKVTSLDEILGSWEGSTSLIIPAQDGPPPTQATSIDCDISLTVTRTTFIQIVDMDMNKFLTDLGGALGKQFMWTTLKESMQAAGDPGINANITFTNDYHVKTTFNGSASDLGLEGENGEYAPYINQDRTKMKLAILETDTAYISFGEEGGTEFILYKK